MMMMMIGLGLVQSKVPSDF